MGESSRHGLPADGWTKFSTQLPKDMAEQFRALAASSGSGGSKILTTVAISIVLSMKPEDRDALARYVVQRTWGGTKTFEPKSVYEGLKAMIRQQEGGEPAGKGDRWYVDRILDPEVTPEPGKKRSDRKTRREDSA